MVTKAMYFSIGGCSPSSTIGFFPSTQKVRISTIRCSSDSSATGVSSIGLAEKPWKLADARLVLEDDSVWRAKSFGASGTQVGEVVFSTSLTGMKINVVAPPERKYNVRIGAPSLHPSALSNRCGFPRVNKMNLVHQLCTGSASKFTTVA